MSEDPDIAKWQEGLRAGRKAQRAKLISRVLPGLIVAVLFGSCLGAVKWIEVSRRAESRRADERRALARVSLTAEERAKAEQIFAKARASATAIDAAKWSLVLGPPPSLMVPSGEACPVNGGALVPSDPGPDATKSAQRMYTAQRQTLALTIDRVSPDGSKDGRSATSAALDAALSPHLSASKEPLAEGNTVAAFFTRLEADVKTFEAGHDGVLVMKDRVEPIFEASQKSFVLGRLRGRFYLVSRATRAIVCVADVDTVGPRGFMIAGEDEADVEGNARAAVARLLTADAIVSGLTTMTRAKMSEPAPPPSASTPSRTAPKRRK